MVYNLPTPRGHTPIIVGATYVRSLACNYPMFHYVLKDVYEDKGMCKLAGSNSVYWTSLNALTNWHLVSRP